MFFKTMGVRTVFAVAALSALAASANAFGFGIDPQIFINRTIDSPTLTVRYSGASAALVELKVNGSSFGTRAVTSSKDSGETNFTLATGDLHPGDNDVEICLYDRTGKLLAKDHTNVSIAPAGSGPVFLSSPKMGDTVRGPVQIKLGFDRDLKDCYVSFFVDGVFKTMSNVPPFEYMWDSEGEANGWHELEAWAIDDSSNTHKTSKLRVFVNNPGGNTHRGGIKPSTLQPSKNLGGMALALTPAGRHKLAAPKSVRPAGDVRQLPATAPAISPEVILGSPAQPKTIHAGSGIVMGPHNMLPTNSRNAKILPTHQVIEIRRHVETSVIVAKAPVAIVKAPTSHQLVAFVAKRHPAGAVANHLATATSLMRITYGSKLKARNLSAFAIALDSEFIDFHGVLPRVEQGIPMTPLRFLLEKKGGIVNWNNPSKVVSANASGNDLKLHIGDDFAIVNKATVKMIKPSYLDRGRTVVPLSFMESALHVKIDYDKGTNHMLITSQH